MQETRLLQQLQAGLEEMQIYVDQHKCSLLIRYVLLLNKWNKAYNLSAVRDPEMMISRHILDSLSLCSRLTELQANRHGSLRILDVGTGPGLPGIPLAIHFPEMKFYLLDSNGKKTRFIFQSLHELGIHNVQVENARVENYQCPEQLDIVTSRAFSSLADFADGCEHLCSPDTRLMAMKGVYPAEELQALPDTWVLVYEQALDIPGCDGERHIIEVMKKQMY
jgi:16S rRNA (guanine527-N7)-methyltransferase